jgi:translation initiation factor 4B
MPDRGSRRELESPLTSSISLLTVSAEFSGPPREELPVPTVPPFTAFVGNLTFETEEDQIREHLGPGITSVRLVKDPMSGKPKGYGYVEFGSQGELKVALSKHMSSLGGRSIRISVAEARTSSPPYFR